MSSPQLKVRASELQNKKRDELVKQLEELKTDPQGSRACPGRGS
jgi:large subunit ribosomal protein L35e